ncbi:MAG TPA: CRTAC1 family protein, partial [Pyrinomonadaceae bacterium]|nr:CRTAC1 family protein [Pyrinomonadaceae bacterium]
MSGARTYLRQHAARLVALGIIFALYGLTRLPEISSAERQKMAESFSFRRLPLPEQANQNYQSVRQVNPSLQRISAWISSVGAAVALNDLDGDGLSNDVCYVDTRTDGVVLAPVPGTPQRYQPFSLNPGALHDRSTMAPMGSLLADLNEDGLMDVLVYYWGRTPVAFLRKRQDGASKLTLSDESYVPREVIGGGERWYTNAATLSDLDGDGHLDIIVGNYFPDGARILDARAENQESMQHSMSRAFNGGRNRLLRWVGATSGAEPSVSFQSIEGAIEGDQEGIISRAWTLAVGAADLDGDLLPEIYFANDFGPDRLLHNRSKPGEFRFVTLEGNKTLTTPNSKVLGRDSFKGMGVDFGDLNNDGLLDIYVSNIAAEYALEESHLVFLSTGETKRMWDGVAPYVDGSEGLGLSRSGWAWDAKLADFDNDGVLEALQATGFVRGEVNRWPELHELAMGNDQFLAHPQAWPRFQPGDGLSDHGHNPFFVRAHDGRYYDLARELGLDQSVISRGIAVADADGDGRLDFALANQWDSSYFFHNESPRPGAFLGLHLRLSLGGSGAATKVCRGHSVADAPSRPAIGAAATVRLGDGRRLVSQSDGGNGHSGKRSPALFFGLGALPADEILDVELDWRDQKGQPQKKRLKLSPG